MCEACDEAAEQQPTQAGPPPGWDFDWHDIMAIGLTVTGGIAQNVGAGFQMLANEFFASARWRRQQRREIEAQVKSDMTFAELVSGWTLPLPEEVSDDGDGD